MAPGLLVQQDPELAAELGESVLDILDSATLMALATSDSDTGAHANAAFFAYDDDLIVYFVSERTTRHSENVRDDPRATAVVYLEPPSYGEGLRGLQLAGQVRELALAETAHALAVYRGRFGSFAADAAVADRFLRAEGPPVLYRLQVEAITVLDEPRFGRRRYIRATVAR